MHLYGYSNQHSSLNGELSLFHFCIFIQTEISYQFSAPRGVPPESPIPEIRIETELENGTYVTSPVEDSEIDRELSWNDRQLPPTATNGRQLPATTMKARPLAAMTTSSRQVPTSTSNGHQMTTGHQSHVNNGRMHKTRPQYQDDDLPPPYPMSQSPRAKFPRNRSSTQPSTRTHSSSPHSAHNTAKKTMSAKAKGMENNLYRAVVMEGFQGITGKVTTV